MINQVIGTSFFTILIIEFLWVTNVSAINYPFPNLTPLTRSPEVIPVAQKIDSPLTISFKLYFLFKTDKDIFRAKKMGISDLNKKYDLNEIVKGDSIFCATGVTTGELVNGVKIVDKKFVTETLVTYKNSLINIVKKEVPITWLIIIFAIKDLPLVPSSIG